MLRQSLTRECSQEQIPAQTLDIVRDTLRTVGNYQSSPGRKIDLQKVLAVVPWHISREKPSLLLIAAVSAEVRVVRV